jgi:nitrate/nitrite-specific signal transduction histidine kinase
METASRDPVDAAGGLYRHFGMLGMRERSAILGGQLEVWTELKSGTAILSSSMTFLSNMIYWVILMHRN